MTGVRYAALFRGINVGRAKRIAMADLRAILEDLGCRDVRTLLNSGNAVFTAPRAAAGRLGERIRKAVATRLGVDSQVTVLAIAELEQALQENPLPQATGSPSRFLIAVLQDPADRRRLAGLARQDFSPEAFALGKRVAYLWLPDGVIQSRVAREVDKLLGDRVTSRNWTTMEKIVGAGGER